VFCVERVSNRSLQRGPYNKNSGELAEASSPLFEEKNYFFFAAFFFATFFFAAFFLAAIVLSPVTE
jgi:hypothetical protein